MSETKVSTKVWRESGSNPNRAEVFAEAWEDLKAEGKVPLAVIPEPFLAEAKKGKQDKADGTWYTVEFSFRKPLDHESTVTPDEIIEGMQPVHFDPADHNDEA